MPSEPHALPDVAYSVAQSRELDRLAGSSFELPGDLLMDRAGRAAAALVRSAFPLAQRIAVVCGTGNNGGDGYVLARLLLEMRREVYIDCARQGEADLLEAVATLHVLGAYMITAFFFIHVYLTTTGHTVFAHIKAMITGWEEVE